MAIDRRMPVLVVDDHGTIRSTVRSQLRQLGFVDVDEANGGSEAIAKLCKRRYGLIFSDWHMEEMSGLDLLKTVRGDPGQQHLRFIMVTGESRTDNVIAAKKAGVSGYMVEPFDPEILKVKIETVFATRSSPLPEREKVAVPAPADAAPAAGSVQLRFPGRFTSDT
jgi:two-component system, chemotaxis family, chemotaxis protein CheY